MNDENGEQDNQASERASYGAHHSVVLVDCHPDMFLPSSSKNSSTAMDAALQTVSYLLQDRIRTTMTLKTGKRDGVGVLLYHTKSKKTTASSGGAPHENVENSDGGNKESKDPVDDEKEHEEEVEDEEEHQEFGGTTVHELIPLAPPGTKAVKTIRALLPDPEDSSAPPARDLKREFMPTKIVEFAQPPLQVALQQAMRAFKDAKCAKKSFKQDEIRDSKTIYIVTNRASPYPDHKGMIETYAKMIQTDDGIDIVLLPVGSPDAAETTFDDEYYQTISNVQYFESPIVLETAEECVTELLVKAKKPRRAFHSRLLLPDDSTTTKDKATPPAASIDVNWYKFVQPATKPTKVPIDQTSRQ